MRGVIVRHDPPFQSYAGDRKLRALPNCVPFLQAQKLSFSVLATNVAHFDILPPLLLAGRLLFYQQKSRFRKD